MHNVAETGHKKKFVVQINVEGRDSMKFAAHNVSKSRQHIKFVEICWDLICCTQYCKKKKLAEICCAYSVAESRYTVKFVVYNVEGTGHMINICCAN